MYLTLKVSHTKHNKSCTTNRTPGEYEMNRIRLRNMEKEQSGCIAAITVGGELGRRIRDMGLVPGTQVTVQGRAPLYDPIALRLMGFTLTLRNKEADFIEVEVEK
jgi:ferrous iron transport protein A